jgi:hypothetical protein
MAVTEEFSKKTYACNGSTVAFDLATKVFATSEVSVLLKTVSTGAVETLAEGIEATEYAIVAISGDLDNGVTVTAGTAYSSLYTITLVRTIAETQGLELEYGGDLPANELEDALDRGMMISQQISELQDRSLSFPVTDPAGLEYEVGDSVSRASKALGFDASGNVTNLSLAETGTVAVNEEKGLDLTGNIISAKVDDTSIEFSATPDFKLSVKDAGISAAMLASNAVTTAKILDDNVTTAKILDDNVTIAKVDFVIDDNSMGTATATNVPSAESTKAYADAHGVVQVVYTQDGTMVDHIAGGSLIPFDDTIPQITEGYLAMTRAITPTSATNKLKIDVVAVFSSQGVNETAALFDGSADAIAVVGVTDIYYQLNTLSFTHYMTAGTTSEISFTVRVGSNHQDTVFNGWNSVATAIYGGTLASSITITEIGT